MRLFVQSIVDPQCFIILRMCVVLSRTVSVQLNEIHFDVIRLSCVHMDTQRRMKECICVHVCVCVCALICLVEEKHGAGDDGRKLKLLYAKNEEAQYVNTYKQTYTAHLLLLLLF